MKLNLLNDAPFFVALTSLPLASTIDNIVPLSTVLNGAVNNSKQHLWFKKANECN